MSDIGDLRSENLSGERVEKHPALLRGAEARLIAPDQAKLNKRIERQCVGAIGVNYPRTLEI